MPMDKIMATNLMKVPCEKKSCFFWTGVKMNIFNGLLVKEPTL